LKILVVVVAVVVVTLMEAMVEAMVVEMLMMAKITKEMSQQIRLKITQRQAIQTILPIHRMALCQRLGAMVSLRLGLFLLHGVQERGLQHG
jgi:hypothetical protein